MTQSADERLFQELNEHFQRLWDFGAEGAKGHDSYLVRAGAPHAKPAKHDLLVNDLMDTYGKLLERDAGPGPVGR